jgi:hypothetical protein
MSLGEPGGLARRLAFDERVRSLSIELEHPVTHDLRPHAPDQRRPRARGAFVDGRECQKPPRPGSIGIRAEWDWDGEPRWFARADSI